MMSIDKSSEASAKAALLKLKKEEQVSRCTVHKPFIHFMFFDCNSQSFGQARKSRGGFVSNLRDCLTKGLVRSLKSGLLTERMRLQVKILRRTILTI